MKDCEPAHGITDAQNQKIRVRSICVGTYKWHPNFDVLVQLPAFVGHLVERIQVSFVRAKCALHGLGATVAAELSCHIDGFVRKYLEDLRMAGVQTFGDEYKIDVWTSGWTSVCVKLIT